MSDFYPGLEVVCVNDAKRSRWTGYGDEAWPVAGKHYTVREVDFTYNLDGLPAVRLVEIVNRVCSYSRGDGTGHFVEGAFDAARFRPVRRESIEIFRAMARSKKPLVPVGAE